MGFLGPALLLYYGTGLVGPPFKYCGMGFLGPTLMSYYRMGLVCPALMLYYGTGLAGLHLV